MQLLISLQSPDELPAALNGGADILDVKDPAKGSLGRPSDTTLAQIVDRTPANIPLSVALGEITDTHLTTLRFSPRIRYAKAGPARLARFPDWQSAWSSYLDHMPHDFPTNGGWVAVIYADHLNAESPPGDQILKFALENPFRGLLVDTYQKDGRSLFDHASASQLRDWKHTAREHGLFFALAGSLREEHIPLLQEIRSDIVAVRGAVCVRQERTSLLDSSLVSRFKQRLLNNSSIPPVPSAHSPN